ncbi:TELO2-interacting protein 1 homolog isoform X2 [Plodia interpunctella]|uniref:TELO2-interacting protein 1 homolog isoform X2 n=1 Tax=Plodia interpunctella TaxID=58824 RepID=UPI002367ED2B|nr:TELO2-interacting protein 1 homolog isoform X2 [Plodia interpunctella]
MLKMNGDIKEAFSIIKPVCDVVMVCPSPETIAAFTSRVSNLKKEVVQELQQYLLFPFITHIKSSEIAKKYELQCRLIDAMRVVLERVTVNSPEMCLKIETGLLQLVFDNSKAGMIADVPEELKYSVMRTLTVLVLNLDKHFRERLLKTQVPLLAQVIFVAVHIAKLEKMRALRLSAIDCLTAHTSTHAQLTNSKCHVTDANLEKAVVEMLSSILPGVLAALQDVATCTDNPGHALVAASIEATHRILCMVMHDKHIIKKTDVTAEDIAKMVHEKFNMADTEVSSKDPKDVPKRSPEWYAMAGDKLTLITKSLAPLRTHEHWKVRKELAVFCQRILQECHTSMQSSVPIVLDILISLSKDEYPAVSQYCTAAVNRYFGTNRHTTTDGLCDNLMDALNCFPKVMNNIDSARKLSALNLVHGYIQVMSDGSRPQQLTTALSVHTNMECLCSALAEVASVHTDLTMLTQHCIRDVTSPPPAASPWCRLRLCDSPQCERTLRDICALLSAAECAELLLDRLLELFQGQRSCEHACLINWMVAGPNSSPSLSRRVLDTYITSDIWYLPLEVANSDAPLTSQDTYDVTVYNPRAWHKDSVPDLYEGATEIRYTDISYQTPRQPPLRHPNSCATLKEAQHNMALSCLLTEGVGIAAIRLGDMYQPYLLKTLCLLLERVGSKYEMLHLAGLKAINDVAKACGHSNVGELIRCNADYFTSQVTLRLKKAWNSESALQILSVVMEYSDSSILDCLYGIVEDVLVQSCDKYYEKNLQSYLQVFVTFIECIRRWFPLAENTENKSTNIDIDVFRDVTEHIKNKEESEKLMSNEEFERNTGKSVEEMYREDIKKKEDDFLDYDDTVTSEKPPLPQHIKVTVTIIKRCLHFVTPWRRDEAILAMQVLTAALPLLRDYEDELLPLVHQSWSGLVCVVGAQQPAALRGALSLLTVMAALAKDFILNRAVKEVLPHIYKYLHTSSSDSYLKDAGSSYRTSQAYSLQVAALTALPDLAVNLKIEDDRLEDTMNCVDAYLCNKQPKPLQALAVEFFKKILDYDFCAAWYHLRKLCDNTHVLEPRDIQQMKLETIVGTPFEATNKEYDANIKLIFNHATS